MNCALFAENGVIHRHQRLVEGDLVGRSIEEEREPRRFVAGIRDLVLVPAGI
jgi:hypothetical protein